MQGLLCCHSVTTKVLSNVYHLPGFTYIPEHHRREPIHFQSQKEKALRNDVQAIPKRITRTATFIM